MRTLLRQWFLWGLLAVTVLALLVPAFGARGGPLRPETSTRFAVAAIFLLQGLGLATDALRRGALHWRLHALVQSFIFALFPLLGLMLVAVAGRWLPADLRTGFLFLCILPTTVSACVVFTASAGGNVAGAVFNSALANVAGVVITPLLAAALLGVAGGGTAVLPMIAEVSLLVLAPLLAGQALRPVLLRRLEPDRRTITALSNVLILYIVYAAFAHSAYTGAFGAATALQTVLVAAGVIVLFVVAAAGAWLAGAVPGIDGGDRTALFFCASHKTLAAGAPLGQVLFAEHAGLGLILLPLMLYHTVQLIAGAALVPRLGTAALSAADAGDRHEGRTSSQSPRGSPRR